MPKSATASVTVKSNVCVLAAGAPAVVAEIVTIFGPPTAAPASAVTIKVAVTGLAEVGLTELDGEKAHAVPLGSPEEQLSATVPAKLPEAVTSNVVDDEVPP